MLKLSGEPYGDTDDGDDGGMSIDPDLADQMKLGMDLLKSIRSMKSVLEKDESAADASSEFITHYNKLISLICYFNL